jgi:hypothetical protein
MRAAYYRAGWPFIKRDVLDRIKGPASFFGAPIPTGVHEELRELLDAVERNVRAKHPALVENVFPKAAGFVIGGFVPRFQQGTPTLSQHAYGLAIDCDADWNPEIKTPTAIRAFKQATGEDLGAAFALSSSLDQYRKIHARLEDASKKLMAWLAKLMPEYDAIEEERKRARKAKAGEKEKLAELDRKVRDSRDLSALKILIDEYTRRKVEQWRVYGIVTLRPEIVESFVRGGAKNRARWGGQYESRKDIMHLELLQLADPKSEGRAGRSGRRDAVMGFSDLLVSNAAPKPVNGPQ